MKLQKLFVFGALLGTFLLAAVGATHAQIPGIIGSGELIGNPSAAARAPTRMTASQWFDRWCSSTNGMVPNRSGGSWVCSTSLSIITGTNISANTVLSNWTSGSAAITANVWPSCPNDGSHALVYINGTGLQCALITVSGAQTPSIPQGRLTLTSGVAITQTDVAGATTHYYTPAVGSYAPITTDGVNFTMTVFTECSQTTADATKSPAAVAASKVYDILLWSDAGTFRCTRGPAWTSDTNRGTGAGTSEVDFTTKFPTNKVAVTNGPAANRGVVVGSIRSNASSQLFDSAAFRWVSNVYQAVPRSMQVNDPAANWTYTIAQYRQCNANGANQIDFLSSLAGNMVDATVVAAASNTNAGVVVVAGIALDQNGTTNGTNVATVFSLNNTLVANQNQAYFAYYHGYPGLGRHTMQCLEYSGATGTTTWLGINGVLSLTGVIGWINN